ncbi:MAG: hypothetical protein DMG05_14710 [Acidobacteria bacterium]|nr:MAG: hypothetical protein DMG05_14710 [Acidobacteriota bacterium]
MNPATWPGHLAYLAVFIAAAVEGEVVFVTASVLVSLGRLDPLAVFLAAMLGGSTGDQFFFYVLRGRLHPWLSRFPRLAQRQEQVVTRVRRHGTMMVLACRFLPGLRIAIPAACAYAGIPAIRFTTLNLIGSAAWAAAILFTVTRLGPASFARFGLNAWWTPIVPALLIILFFHWLGRGSSASKA